MNIYNADSKYLSIAWPGVSVSSLGLMKQKSGSACINVIVNN
jgi:hypothetical protein